MPLNKPIEPKATREFVEYYWDSFVISGLSEFISIPSVTANYDVNWEKNNHLFRAAESIANWAAKQDIIGLKFQILKIAGKPPVLFIEVPSTIPHSEASTVMFYGHLDKMPENSGWAEGLGPWKPMRIEDKLFGRGAVDDGYAAFAALTAIKALQVQNAFHDRCVLIIEGGEESGSPDLSLYFEKFHSLIGDPKLVIAIDADAADSERAWQTVSVRGLIDGVLNVEILAHGVHSGEAGGIIPSTFRILRQLLDRIENKDNGDILLDSSSVEIPELARAEADKLAGLLGDKFYSAFPWLEGARPVSKDISELILNQTWRSALSITGAEGLPQISNAGNVLLPFTKILLSLRLPPRASAALVSQELKRTLERDPPYGAKVFFEVFDALDGWDSYGTGDTHVQEIFAQASKIYYGNESALVGVGGFVPLSSFKRAFAKAQLLLTGAAITGSNSHGPNEFLDVSVAKKLTCCLAHLLAEQAGL